MDAPRSAACPGTARCGARLSSRANAPAAGKSAGGQWDAQQRVWKLRYDRVVALGLSKRIVETKRL